MAQSVKSILRTEVVLSDDNQHRLLLKKSWNSKQPMATIITKFPNHEGQVKVDLTTQLIVNNVSEMGYGGVYVVNLVTNMDAHNGMEEIETLVHEEAAQYITQSAKESEVVIFAWGSITSKLLSSRVKDIKDMLEPYADKIKVLINPSTNSLCHPLNPKSRHLWMIGEYEGKDKSKVNQPKEAV